MRGGRQAGSARGKGAISTDQFMFRPGQDRRFIRDISRMVESAAAPVRPKSCIDVIMLVI